MMQLLKIQNILMLSSLLALTACNDEAVLTSDTLAGNGEKTPISVSALLDANGKVSQTRAADKEFSTEGDELNVMLRHVTWTGKKQGDDGYDAAADEPKNIVSGTALISKLVTFTAKSKAAYNETIEDILPFDEKKIGIDPTTTNQAASLSPSTDLYWDDFSVGKKGDVTDIRTEEPNKHYLQSYYGYCYNGGNPSSDLVEATGVLGWSVAANQTAGIQNSDLLWSPAQLPVRYEHNTAVGEKHGQVLIPFLHAMSKVTINVIAGEGFDAEYNFMTGSVATQVELKDIRLKCTATAPTASLTFPAKSESGAKGAIVMKPGTGKSTRAFEAIVVPSILTVGNTLATISNMDGDTYDIFISEDMLAEKADQSGWGNQLDNADEDVDNGTAQARPSTRADGPIGKGKGHQMRSGVHYVLNVTVSKTAVNVSATILDWDEVYAEGVGEIRFDNDVKDKDGTIDSYLKDNGFDVYMSAYDASNPTADVDYGTRDTHLRYNKTTNRWKYDPILYWQGGTAQYFRALSNVRTDASDTPANESLIMENGRDALWGTTQEGSGYQEGEAVKPRTGQVPLKFIHAMSMITFYLEDALKDNTDTSARINLEGATIQLTHLATGGKLNLHTGITTADAVVEKILSEDLGAVPSRMGYFAAQENGQSTADRYEQEYILQDYVVTPQTITNDAQVVITLADGTIYKGQLNLCTQDVTANGSSTPTAITKWERGNHYKYNIVLGKETITFRALVEPWNPVEGGGKATLEWD